MQTCLVVPVTNTSCSTSCVCCCASGRASGCGCCGGGGRSDLARGLDCCKGDAYHSDSGGLAGCCATCEMLFVCKINSPYTNCSFQIRRYFYDICMLQQEIYLLKTYPVLLVFHTSCWITSVHHHSQLLLIIYASLTWDKTRQATAWVCKSISLCSKRFSLTVGTSER